MRGEWERSLSRAESRGWAPGRPPRPQGLYSGGSEPSHGLAGQYWP
jgi:hypothetical protein